MPFAKTRKNGIVEEWSRFSGMEWWKKIKKRGGKIKEIWVEEEEKKRIKKIIKMISWGEVSPLA